MSELEDMMKKVLSSPEDMSKIMQLAQSLTGGDPEEQPQPSSSQDGAGPDPELSALLGRIMRGMQSAGGSDKTALVSALKPYLKDERRSKLDRAMKLAKIAKIASGALGDMGGGAFGL